VGRTITPNALEWIHEIKGELGDGLSFTLDYLAEEAAVTLAKAITHNEVALYVKDLTPESARGSEGFADSESYGGMGLGKPPT
jgi:hypothetical protein